jgi:hypothetical protein
LHLLEGLSGIDALMLPSVPNEQNPILRPNLFEKRLHLPGAGETGLVENIKVPGVRVSGAAIHTSTRQKALQGIGLNASIPELAGGSTCGSKAFDSVSISLRALADGFKSRGFTAARQPLQPMYSVVGCEHLFDDSLLCWIQELASTGVVGGILRDAATTYKVDVDAIGLQVKQEFAAKEQTRLTKKPTTKAVAKAQPKPTKKAKAA